MLNSFASASLACSNLLQCRNLSKNQIFTWAVECKLLVVTPTSKGNVLAMQAPSQRGVNSLLLLQVWKLYKGVVSRGNWSTACNTNWCAEKGSVEPADKSHPLSTQYGQVAVLEWIVSRSSKTSESQLPPESYLQFPIKPELSLRRSVY